jgi:hypothetical protein
MTPLDPPPKDFSKLNLVTTEVEPSSLLVLSAAKKTKKKKNKKRRKKRKRGAR